MKVECIVDWRKMTLTNSDNYARLKRSGIDLLGAFCTPQDPMIEVAPDMHNKFIIFGGEDVITGSFNITFDRWWANWESGMTFCSRGVCRLFDNIFQSVRGGVIQRYGIDAVDGFPPFHPNRGTLSAGSRGRAQ
jgi:phosphatidylserine/phosphatidylglycerophosphate/cardiolipin synthase-like enzyme